jgi:hypothetical protein
MGQIRADTEAIAASAVGLGGVSPVISSAASMLSQSGDAAAGTAADAAYDALNSHFGPFATELEGAADQLAAAAQAAARCYIASDKLTETPALPGLPLPTVMPDLLH